MRLSWTKEYRAWREIIRRCQNPNRGDYRYYGGRGIRVCARWRNSFANFLNDMGIAPSRLHTVDRRNNDGNYEPGNCRWATRAEQAINSRQCHMVAFRGETMPLTQWAIRTGIKVENLYTRLNRLGWSTERALTTPARTFHRGNGQKISFSGQTLSLSEWAERLSLNLSTLWVRLNYYGWSVERALTTPSRQSR
jgi:hypothetical protein